MRHSTKAYTIFLLGAVVFAAAPGASNPQPTVHQGEACGPCHLSVSISSESFKAPANAECLGCHQANQISKGVFHASAQGRCVDCHNFHEPENITVSPSGTPQKLIGTTDGGHCQSCHDPRGTLSSLSSAHKAAANLYHNEADQLAYISPSQACLRCHSDVSGSSWQTVPEDEILAFNTHASHPYSIRVIPGQGNSTNWIREEIDPRLPLFDGVMECQTCHLLTANNDDLMVPFATKYDLCNGCHQHYGDDENKAGNLLATFVQR